LFRGFVFLSAIGVSDGVFPPFEVSPPTPPENSGQRWRSLNTLPRRLC
jgi:hypothetical protein